MENQIPNAYKPFRSAMPPADVDPKPDDDAMTCVNYDVCSHERRTTEGKYVCSFDGECVYQNKNWQKLHDEKLKD